jgi:hypothetical protein
VPEHQLPDGKRRGGALGEDTQDEDGEVLK